MVFEKLHGMEFSWVLLRVFWFYELILDKVLSVDLGRPGPPLDLRVVSAENTGNALITNEVLVCIWHFAFRLHAVDVYHVGVDPIEDLGTGGSPKGTGVGKVCVCGHSFPEVITVEPGKMGLDMPPHGESERSCCQLRHVFQSLPDDVDWAIS